MHLETGNIIEIVSDFLIELAAIVIKLSLLSLLDCCRSFVWAFVEFKEELMIFLFEILESCLMCIE